MGRVGFLFSLPRYNDSTVVVIPVLKGMARGEGLMMNDDYCDDDDGDVVEY